MRELASRSGLALQTVHRFESGEELREETMGSIETAYISGGLILIDADNSAGEGVRFALKPRRKKLKK
jgi:hypothetical protein